MIFFLIASACVGICYILYLSKISAIMFEEKASIFPFLFRDIFWRWAGSEASLILEGRVKEQESCSGRVERIWESLE